MKFQLVAPDCTYEYGLISGGINGGTVWLDNIAQALRYWGHEAIISQMNSPIDSDYVIIQSEFINKARYLKDFKNKGGKVIVLLGHFKCNHYPPMEEVKGIADFIATPWEGELMEGIEALFMPHAYNDLIDNNESDYKGNIIFIGNSYKLREEDWFDKLDITKLKGVLPKNLPAIYRGANVCVNIHGDFQKNIVAKDKSSIADKSGTMINERFWTILGSGALLITDYVEQMDKFFSKDSLITAKTKEEFRDLVEYYNKHKENGLKKLEFARDLIREKHTYKERVKNLLDYIKC